MEPPLWSENLDRLRESLLAQLARIRAGSSHSTIKGTSLEVVLRRTLREYVPGYFRIGSGQIANRKHELSPQLDILVYDQTVFPHLAVNEDCSIVICCEALFGAVECKATWDNPGVHDHFSRFTAVESERNENYAGSEDAAAYYVVVFDNVSVKADALGAFSDAGRYVGIYTVQGNKCWSSPVGEAVFTERTGNSIALLLKDILLDCMKKGQKDVGNLMMAYAALRQYIEADERAQALPCEVGRVC